MKGAKIIVLVVCLVFLLGAVLLYFFYEKPVKEQPIEYNTLNIRTYDEETGDQLAMNYIISIIPINNLYKQGLTTNTGFIKEQIPVNNSFRVLAVPLINQSYYTNFVEYDDTDMKPSIYRIEIPVRKAGTLAISSNSTFPSNNPYFINVTSNGIVENVGICFRWTRNMISVKINGEVEDKPKRLENKVDKCYNLETTLNNSFIEIPISFVKFGSLASDDKIIVYILDGEVRYQNPYKILREELDDETYIDIGSHDIIYEIKNG